VTPDRWRLVKQVAEAAIDLPREHRAGAIASACGSDDALRREVESLLDAVEAAAPLYETPALRLDGARFSDAGIPSAPAAAGQRVGPYRLEREIGKGGMGRVFLARRDGDDFDQRVAVKFVDHGAVAAPAIIERFRQERRILAMLDHPNIARLIDGGATADGRPYVVMEYVDGAPIDEYCDGAGLDLRARLRLVRDVGAAVHYAHQRLVVHRDIKPGNILVTPDGVVKLLDFGIATLLEQDRDPASRARTVLRALTLETASPEQLRAEPVTVATDVYGLGLLLYRLLTRRSPYGSGDGSDAALIRAICEDPPTPPSDAVRAAGPQSPPLDRVPRELDRIVLKALRKEPDRRYGSVAELCDDVQRYLDGRPVHAVPDSRLYRLGKFTRRHWVAVGAGSLAFIALAVAAGAAWHQARVAGDAQRIAERRFDDVRQVANSLLFEFHDAIENLPGSLPARQLLVRRAAEYLDTLARDAESVPGLQRDLATAHLRLAGILGGGGVSNLGDLDGAGQHYEKALALLRGVTGRPGASSDDASELARAHVERSRFLILRGDLKQAAAEADEAVRIMESPQVDHTSAEWEGRLATTLHQAGYVRTIFQEEAAVPLLERAMHHATAGLKSQPDDPGAAARLARIATDFASAMLSAGRAPEALRSIVEARQGLETLRARDVANSRYRRDLALLLSVEADALAASNAMREAVDAIARSADLLEALLHEAPGDQGTQVGLMLARCSRGRLEIRRGDIDAGLAYLQQCIDDGRGVVRASPTHYYVLTQIATARIAMGRARISRSATDPEGCRLVGEGLGELTRVAAKAPAMASAETLAYFQRVHASCNGRGATGGRSGR
jgi:non-specific serine/threonine protein kinase/serine/threonine-protein kinase